MLFELAVEILRNVSLESDEYKGITYGADPCMAA